MARPAKLILQAAAVLVVVLLVALLGWKVTQQEEGRGLSDALERGERPHPPVLVFDALDGDGDISLADYKGKAVVLNFWASWCEPCKDEAPLLEEICQRHRDDGLVVLGIDAQDFRTDARRFVDFALSVEGQKIGLDVKEYAIPTNRGVVLPPQVPNLADLKLIDYDFAKYGSSAERRRLLDRWEKEINALAR